MPKIPQQQLRESRHYESEDLCKIEGEPLNLVERFGCDEAVKGFFFKEDEITGTTFPYYAREAIEYDSILKTL